MDITPHVELLRALRQQSFKHSTLIAELVDNSLDAAASRVEISIGPSKHISISDDGIGCEDIAAMLTLGGRHNHKSTRLGRYGIGLKDAALYFWGITTIETVHKSEVRRISVNWPMLESSGQWTVGDPVVESAGHQRGTKISFAQIIRNLPQVEPLLDELGYVFAPAIMSGRQISLMTRGSRRLCTAYQLPPISDVVESTFEINGKGARLHAGIVLEGHSNKRSGFIFQHGHRSILNSALGCGHYNSSRIAGIVELDGKWALSKNKDDITELQDELGEAIFARCEGILRRADIQAKTIDSTALADEVSKRLTEALQSLGATRRREARDRENKQTEGTVKAKGSGKTRRRAKRIHDIDGNIERAARGGVKVEWSDSLNGSIGFADLRGALIKLNSRVPLLARLRREENADAIAILAFTVFVDKVRECDGYQRYLPSVEPVSFVDSLGKVLAGMSDSTEPKIKVAG